MTMSLKASLPVLSRLIRISPNVLYERQKVLMQEGLLTSVPGRGPGSGVLATPEALSLLLIAFFTAPFKLSDLAGDTQRVAKATPVAGKKCPLTGKANFLEALGAALSNKQLRESMTEVRVAGSHTHAEIHFRDKRKICVSAFDGHKIENPGIRFDFSLMLDQIPNFDEAIGSILDSPE